MRMVNSGEFVGRLEFENFLSVVDRLNVNLIERHIVLYEMR